MKNNPIRISAQGRLCLTWVFVLFVLSGQNAWGQTIYPFQQNLEQCLYSRFMQMHPSSDAKMHRCIGLGNETYLTLSDREQFKHQMYGVEIFCLDKCGNAANGGGIVLNWATLASPQSFHAQKIRGCSMTDNPKDKEVYLSGLLNWDNKTLPEKVILQRSAFVYRMPYSFDQSFFKKMAYKYYLHPTRSDEEGYNEVALTQTGTLVVAGTGALNDVPFTGIWDYQPIHLVFADKDLNLSSTTLNKEIRIEGGHLMLTDMVYEHFGVTDNLYLVGNIDKAIGTKEGFVICYDPNTHGIAWKQTYSA